MLAVFDNPEGVNTQVLEEHLQSVNNQLEAHEKISNVIICKQPWTIENGLLTHTMKLLRDDIESLYEPLVQSTVAGNSDLITFEA